MPDSTTRDPRSTETGDARRGPIRFVDTSLRDGNQSLWASVGLTTGMTEAIGPILDRIGLEGIDFTSSTNLLMGAKTHAEDPWERIARTRAAVENTRLSAITTGMRFMSWERASETVMRLSLRLMAQNGLSRLQIADPMNDIGTNLKVARWAKEEGFDQIVIATTFTESPVHSDTAYGEAAAEYAGSDDVDTVYLKDPGGLLTVERARTLLPELLHASVNKSFELHSHCTTGEAPLVYLLAAQLGVEVLHTGIGALANGTAQPRMQEVMDNLDALGIGYQADRQAVDEASALIDSFAAAQGLAPGRTMPLDLSPHRHQVPGGMMGTLRRQLAEIGELERLDEVIAEAGRVRADLGYPIMVTPFSQFVGSQALMNVLSRAQGRPRYERIPDEIARFVLGQFGTPAGTIDPRLRHAVADSPRRDYLESGISNDLPLEELRERDSERAGRRLDDEELLLRLVMPAGVLDEVLASGPAPAWTSPARTATTAEEFLTGVESLPKWRSLEISTPSTSISLRR